ncbi:hypothetical protein [Kolpuevirus frurule]|uniref:Uncharacterized protein n=1 Tax=Kolpuevirus sp. 'frurule' TaxID=3028514 RepID=A0AAF0DP90_9CAUD|nr:hypothetical protein [Kolpuevirus sp. 'frurule']
MEARKILFVLSNSSNQKSIMSEAETLGALKADMRRAGISYEGMTFYEGRTRTELKDDASVLPVNVPVPAKGTNPATTTNDLVFMLTTANKKIKSGALSPERKNVLDEIKAKGLGAAVTAKFGKNATQCKTPDLLAFLAEQSKPASQVATKAPKTKKGVEVVSTTTDENPDITITEVIKGEPIAGVTPCTECVDVVAREVLCKLIERLNEEDDLYDDYSDLIDELSIGGMPGKQEQPTETKAVKEEKLSNSEINDLFGGWAK